MYFGLSEEQAALRDATRRFLEAEAPTAYTRATMATATGEDRALWAREAGELGWAALAVPEALGGFGLGMVELAVVMEELGRVVHPSPFFATVCLALGAVVELGSEAQQAAWIGPLLAGEATGTLAWRTHPRAAGLEATGGRWRTDGEAYVLDGELVGVVDGATADTLLVALRGEGATDTSVRVFHVSVDARGLTRTAHATMDQTRRLATIRLDGVRVGAADALPGGAAALERVLDRAAIALAAEQVGVAERALDLAVDYAKVRKQFGRPIGSFQAIKHTCANLLVAVESARSAAWYAAWAADHAPEELAVAASMARAWCTDACFQATADCIQVHGGIGFTWEHDAHLYFKRAQGTAAVLGDAPACRERLATKLGW